MQFKLEIIGNNRIWGRTTEHLEAETRIISGCAVMASGSMEQTVQLFE